MMAHSVAEARSQLERTRRNLNPHKEARVAMYIWGARYARMGGGSMDFWDSLSKSDQRICRELVDKLERTPERASRS